LATRRSDRRLVLRETAQTSIEDMQALQDLDRHRFCNTNNVWIDLERLAERLDEQNGVLGLPLIRNVKTVDPADSRSPRVIQLESAMAAAVECFDGARSIEVPRDRFVPVKTTNDLLVLWSDLYALDDSSRLVRAVDGNDPYVDLDPAFYKLMGQFEPRFPDGAPSLRGADRLVVRGDVTFGADVVIRGDVRIDLPQPAVLAGTVLSGEAAGS
jgi:UTP--glucose-1-phosphate uridylyltransferase